MQCVDFQAGQNTVELKTSLTADYLCANDELQKIFDDLLNDPEDPIDFDRFCNEVIEKEFADEHQQQEQTQEQHSRETTPSPATVSTTASFESQSSMGSSSYASYDDSFPADIFEPANNGHQSGAIVTPVYGAVAPFHGGVSPTQQVPSPSNIYTNTLSPVLSVKEETLYHEQKPTQFLGQPMPVWDGQSQPSASPIFEDSSSLSFTDPFLLPFEDDILISSDNFWVETTIEA